jgi:predicted nucleic acid-binding protein
LDSGSKWLTQFRYSKAPKILIEVHRETRKASDIYHLQRKAQELRATCHNMTTPKEEEIQDCAVSRKNHGYSLWDEKSVSCKLLALRDNMEF